MESKSQTFWQFKPTKHFHPDKIFVSKEDCPFIVTLSFLVVNTEVKMEKHEGKNIKCHRSGTVGRLCVSNLTVTFWLLLVRKTLYHTFSFKKILFVFLHLFSSSVHVVPEWCVRSLCSILELF